MSHALTQIDLTKCLFERDSTPASEAALINLEDMGKQLRLLQDAAICQSLTVEECVAIGMNRTDSPHFDKMPKLISWTKDILRHCAKSNGIITLGELRRIAKDHELLGMYEPISYSMDILKAAGVIEGPTERHGKKYKLGPVGKDLSA